MVVRRSFLQSYLHSLELFVRADPSVADLPITTTCPICPGEMASHTHQMTVGLPCTPQPATWWLQEWAWLRAFTEGELTLTIEVIGGSGLHIWKSQCFLRLIEQTIPWKTKSLAVSKGM